MKKTIVALMALCFVCSSVVSAQTAKKSKNSKAAQTQKSSNEGKAVPYFEGTIYYSKLEKPAPMPMPKAAPEKKKIERYNIESKMSAAVTPKKELKANMEYRYYFENGACYFDMMGLYGEYQSQSHRYTLGFTNPDQQYVKHSTYLKDDLAALWSALQAAQEAQSKYQFEKANKLLEKYYTRTSDQVTLAGYTAVRYEVRLPNYQGDIWVAEELYLSTWMAPFWGMVHPVLEFDFSFPVDGYREKTFRMVADAVKEDVMKEQIYYISKPYLDCPSVPYNEFEDFLRVFLMEKIK